MNVRDYLARIGNPVTSRADLAGLRKLHRAHLYHVPFENLDIPLGRTIELEIESFYDKIVSRRRGGFCYELNGLFAWLLAELGFELQLLSARVFRDDGSLGPEGDHLLLRVELDRPWLADVGFGDSFLDPIPLEPGELQQDETGYRLAVDDENTGEWILERRDPQANWDAQYRFSLEPHSLDDFQDACRYQQTSPASVFTRKSVCSLATRQGRVTLSGGRLIVTEEGQRHEQTIEGEAEYRQLLLEHFGFALERDAEVQRLLEVSSA